MNAKSRHLTQGASQYGTEYEEQQPVFLKLVMRAIDSPAAWIHPVGPVHDFRLTELFVAT